MSAFNHVVVAVDADEGTYWVDPTNKVSFGGAMEDISDRETFVLKPNNKDLDRIIDGMTSSMLVKQAFDFEGDLVKARGILKYDGIFAKAFHSGSKDENEHDKSLLKSSNERLSPFDWKISGLKRNSNIIKNEKVNFTYSAKNNLLKEDEWFLYEFENKITKVYALANKKRVTDFYISSKLKHKEMTFLKGAKIVDSSFANCNVKSKWIDVSRKITENKKGIKVISKFEIKKKTLKHEDFIKDEWEILVDRIDSCANTNFSFTLDKNFIKEDPLKELFAGGKLNLSVLEDLSDNRSNRKLLQVSNSLIKKLPDNPYGYYFASKATRMLGYHSYGTFEGDSLSKALSLADKMIKLDPRNVLFIDYYSQLNSNADNDEVAKKYQKILENDFPNHPLTQYRIASMYTQGSEAKERVLLDFVLKNIDQLTREHKIDFYSFFGDQLIKKLRLKKMF